MTASDTSKQQRSAQYLRWGIAAAVAAGLHASAIAAASYGWWQVPVGGDPMADLIDVALPTDSVAPSIQSIDAPRGPLSEEVREKMPEAGGKAAEEKTVDAPPAEDAELAKPSASAALEPAESVQQPDKTRAQKAAVKPGRDKAEQRPQRKQAPPRAAQNAQAAVRATAGERPSPAAQSDYGAQVMAHLSRFRIYPREAQAGGVQGLARVRVAVTASGQVTSAQVSQSSGSGVIDQAALATVRRANPLPAPPPGVSRSLVIPLNFALR